MDKLSKVYDLKDTVRPPKRCLGANVGTCANEHGQEMWTLSSDDYVKNTTKLVKEMLQKEGKELPTGKK